MRTSVLSRDFRGSKLKRHESVSLYGSSNEGATSRLPEHCLSFLLPVSESRYYLQSFTDKFNPDGISTIDLMSFSTVIGISCQMASFGMLKSCVGHAHSIKIRVDGPAVMFTKLV